MTDALPLARPAERWAEARRTAHNAARALAMVVRASPALTVALAVLTAFAALIPPATAWAGKRIVDAVVAHSSPGAIVWVGAELALATAQGLAQRGLAFVSQVLGLRLGVDVNLAVLSKAVGLSLPHFEDSEFYDKMTRARREASTRPLQLVRESFGLVQSVLLLGGYAALLLRYSSVIVLVLVFATIPATVAEMRTARLAFQMKNRRSQEWRRLTYLEHVLANDEHAKEVKLFALGPPLLARYRSVAEQLVREDTHVAVRRLLGQLLSLLATFAFYGAYGVMALAAAAGRITLGNLTLYVVAFRQGQQAFQSVLGSIGSMYEQNLYMTNLFEFLDGGGPETALTPALAPSRAEGARQARVEQGGSSLLTDGSAPNGITFDHVSFRYPGKSDWALRDLSLVIPGGSSIALVGENGAGKTTLVKLLTRLYEPDEGRILLDGVDLRAYAPDALRARFGVVFQDFNQYQLTAGDNVGLGDVRYEGELDRIARAAVQGGAAEVIAGLPDGYATALGTWFRGGTELSGGQWQKIALSRAFMRQDADILILDEPTAALDAEAEHRVFERFQALAHGRTTVVISHRFPTVRMADRIVVLDHGRIVEQGTHAELIALGGRYARMFELQARGYR